MEQLGAQVQDWLDDGRRVALARVLGLEGFSTWTGDPLVALDGAGGQIGDILGRYGSSVLMSTAAEAAGRLQEVDIDIHGDAVVQNGLSCGGQAHLLVQPAAEIPGELWAALVQRAPVALVTRIDGPTAGPASMVVLADGSWHGSLAVGEADHLARQAVELFGEGGHGVRRVEDGAGIVLLEAWVPDPRLVVAGDGDLVSAIEAQAALLGWETRSAIDVAGVSAGLDWGGASAALVVLSHDPHIDAPVLRRALDEGVAYIGAMGSRRTQSRRLERLRSEGVEEAALERIHRPIGLDLGGRRPAEMALAIVAEILAVRAGRDGRPLSQREGPINPPAALIPG